MTYTSTTDPITDDIRLVAARRKLWDKEPWRDPGMLALILRKLKTLADDETEPSVARAEAEMLIKKLHISGKRPKDAC